MESGKKRSGSARRRVAIALSALFIVALALYVHSEWDYNETKSRLFENADFHSKELKSYYIDFSHTVGPSNLLDDNGIILADYRGGIGARHNLSSICQYALGLHEFYQKTGDEKYLRGFLRQADWLLENGAGRGETLLWTYNFDNPFYEGVKAPWRSAMAQGEAVSVLLRAHRLTGRAQYLDAASRGVRSFYRTIAEGGVVHREGDFVFLEEVAAEHPGHILNGGVFALLGVYDYYRATGDKRALAFFNEAAASLSESLPRFDFGFWSKYELMRGPEYGHSLPLIATMGYQQTHVDLLAVMYEITGDERFDEYAKKWKKQSMSFSCRLLNFVYLKIIYRATRIPFLIRKALRGAAGRPQLK